MNPRVLIVEDELPQLDWAELALHQIPDDQKRLSGIDAFEVVKAACATDARQILRAAARSSQPFDLLLLDLGLPEELGDKSPGDPMRGLSIMALAKGGAAKEILIYSVYSQYDFVADAHRGGSVDFLEKSTKKEELQTAVLRGWRRVLAKETDRILDSRIKTLIPYAQKGLAYRFGVSFSSLVQSVLGEVEHMETGLADRLGLSFNTDSRDPLIDHLARMKEAASSAIKEWTEVQTAVPTGSEMLQRVTIEELLGEIARDLLPCLTIKRTDLATPKEGKTLGLSFGDDVGAVLREILVGALNDLPDNEEGPKFNITVAGNTNQQVEVRLSDNLLPIPAAVSKSINSGFAMIPDEHFGRVWGLSVAQHVALRGGGRLIIEPAPNGNWITYLIPQAQPEAL